MYKFIRTIVFTLLTVISMQFIVSCEKNDKDVDWGFPLIYMPQSTLHSGGLNNFYYVPRGATEWNKNYLIEDNNIKVVLGVYRAGLQELNAYSVDVVAEPDKATEQITNGKLTNTVLLPADAFSIPSKVDVPDGQREATFNLTINRDVLLANYPAYVGKRLAIAISLKNPTNYSLNEALSTTIVVVDVNWDTLQ